MHMYMHMCMHMCMYVTRSSGPWRRGLRNTDPVNAMRVQGPGCGEGPCMRGGRQGVECRPAR